MLVLILEEVPYQEIQGKQLAQMYDNHFPLEYLDSYLDYYEMTKQEFMNVFDVHVNKGCLKRRRFMDA